MIELARYEAWEEGKPHLLFLADVVTDERIYQTIRGKGAGRNIITAFAVSPRVRGRNEDS